MSWNVLLFSTFLLPYLLFYLFCFAPCPRLLIVPQIPDSQSKAGKELLKAQNLKTEH